MNIAEYLRMIRRALGAVRVTGDEAELMSAALNGIETLADVIEQKLTAQTQQENEEQGRNTDEHQRPDAADAL